MGCGVGWQARPDAGATRYCVETILTAALTIGPEHMIMMETPNG
jgi:hypothetical protein